MKYKTLFALRLLLGLVVLAIGNGQTGSLGLVFQQIEAIGPRQWLNLMAGTIAPTALVSERIARGSSRVTAQVAADISHGSEGENQFSGLLHERVEDVPALLFGGREHGSDDHEVVGVVLGTESAGDFLP